MNYPLWLEVFLAICMGLALAGLGAWLFYTAAIKLIRSATRLEAKRTNRETEALNSWQDKYDEERADHLSDVADLTNEILTLKREIEVKNLILAKVKVADL